MMDNSVADGAPAPDGMDPFSDTVLISMFDRGEAAEIFQKTKEVGARVVMKDEVPECVLLSPEAYGRLLDRLSALENECFELTAFARSVQRDPAGDISCEQLMKESGITEKDLAGWEDIELE